MPTTTTEARKALDKARTRYAELEEAIREGSEDITAAQLADATAEIRTAVLRLEAAERAEERTAQATRAHDADVVRQEFEHFIGRGSERARKAYSTAVAALRTLIAEADALNTTRSELAGRASNLGVDLPLWDIERAVDGGGEVFAERAAREAQGHEWPHPHALHTDEARKAHAEKEQRLAEAERERHERFMANTEVTDTLGRRISA